MTTKSHKTLTGNQLHEPKGADTATADTVYVANGSGSGSWAKIDATQMTGDALAFQDQYLRVTHEVTGGGNYTYSSGRQTIPLNTTGTNGISGASLDTVTHEVILPAGTYYMRASTPQQSGGISVLALLDNTNTVYKLRGTSESSSGNTIRSFCNGQFTVSGTTRLVLQFYVATGSLAFGAGVNFGTFTTEVFTEAEFWKVG